MLADAARATALRESWRRSLLAAGATMGNTHEVGISFSTGRSRRSLVMISSASRLSIAAPSSLRIAAGYREPAVILVRLSGVARGCVRPWSRRCHSASVTASALPCSPRTRVAVGAADDHDQDHRQTERPQRLSLAMQQRTCHSLSCPACAALPRGLPVATAQICTVSVRRGLAVADAGVPESSTQGSLLDAAGSRC